MRRLTLLAAFPLFLLACSSASLSSSSSDASTPTDSASSSPPPTGAGDAQPPPESDDAGATDSGSFPNDASPAADALPTDADTVDSAPTFVTTNDAGIFTFDVVSPSVCTEKAAHLVDCTFHPLAIVPSTTNVAPLVQSVLAFQESGNCSTQFDTVFQLNANGANVVNFHLSDKTATVRRTDSTAITSLVITEISQWTNYAAYDDTCRLSVEVQMNEPAAP
ncbi:MAG TPA: hypothetical protein VGI39_29525 [Polyangiaceae bacterium]|jgi:hypothetical protein